MSFKVVKAGFLSSVQDYGRFGHAKHGMSQSGVMDEQAYAWGNYLLNNHFNDAAIEITFGGLELVAKCDTFVAVTGADLNFKINGEYAKMWHTLKVSCGDILTWGVANCGVRAYLTVKGGIQTQLLFDSRSTNLREGIAQALVQDDELPCKPYSGANYRFTPAKFIPNYIDDLTLRILPSYQFDEFSLEQKELFFNQSYRISNANDRSGCRLDGAAIALPKQGMISEGVSYGSVEISSDGLPIIILKDGPSIGGYRKIGTVFSLDLAKLAQKQAHSKVRFKLITIFEAQRERKLFNNFFKIEA